MKRIDRICHVEITEEAAERHAALVAALVASLAGTRYAGLAEYIYEDRGINSDSKMEVGT